MKAQLMVVGIVLALAFIISDHSPGNVVEAQSVSCGSVASVNMRDGQPYFDSRSNQSSAHCINVQSYGASVEMDLSVTNGSLNLWVQAAGESNFTNYGRFPKGPLQTISIKVPTLSGPAQLAFEPVNSAGYSVRFSDVLVTANTSAAGIDMPDDCPDCELTTLPGPGYANISLEYRGDLVVLPVEICAGEMRVSVTGLLERGHAAIHVLSATASPPTVQTTQSYRPNWNPEYHSLYSFRRFTQSDVRSSPVWFVYVVRTGDPVIRGRNEPLNISVAVDDNCGQYPLDYARRPQQSIRTSPRSGASRLGGVDVATYCRQRNLRYIPRTVNDQFWVCYDPTRNAVAFTVETSDFNAMCVNTYGKGAYMVKQVNQTTGGECYR